MPTQASPPASPAWRNRVKELRYVSPQDLDDHPLQWRTHPDHQRSALRGVLEEVGIAGALLAYESPSTGRLVKIDGHARASLDADTPWPTLILDVTDEEAALLLATHDPLAALAEGSKEQLNALLHQVQSGDPAVQQLLEGLAIEHKLIPGYGSDTSGPEDDDIDTTPVPGPESNVRMVQLFLTSETYPAFERMVQALAEEYGTSTITDTVVECLTRAVS